MCCRSLSSVVALLGLTACGGGGSSGGNSGIDPRLARLDVYEAQQLRLFGNPQTGAIGMAITQDPAIPAAGTLNFEGAAAIQIEHSSKTLALYGDAVLALDFEAATAAGSVSNVFGQALTGKVADYTGELSLAGDGLEGAEFQITYAGRLTTDATDYGFAGTLETMLLGDQVAGVAGIDLDADIAHGAGVLTGSVIVFGEVAATQDTPVAP
ncbi:hypothetical protein [Yoonia litorea]|nr:hypothetical protein [Yoonia litorea]